MMHCVTKCQLFVYRFHKNHFFFNETKVMYHSVKNWEANNEMIKKHTNMSIHTKKTTQYNTSLSNVQVHKPYFIRMVFFWQIINVSPYFWKFKKKERTNFSLHIFRIHCSFFRQSLYEILLKTFYDVLQFYRELRRAEKKHHKSRIKSTTLSTYILRHIPLFLEMYESVIFFGSNFQRKVQLQILKLNLSPFWHRSSRSNPIVQLMW